MEDLEAFREFLGNRQPPRSLSESTAFDAVEFLRSLPSDRIVKVAASLSAATFTEIAGERKESPFGTTVVTNFLEEYAEKKLSSGGYKSETTGGNDDKELLFETHLVTSDVGNIDSLVFASDDRSRYYFSLATVSECSNSLLRFEDEEGRPWLFGYSYDNVSQRCTFNKGWSSYVKEKQLGARDYVSFQRHRTDSSRLFIGFRRHGGDDSVLSKLSSLDWVDSTSQARSSVTEEVETPLQLRKPAHSIIGVSNPVFVFYCGDNQDPEETEFISYIPSELCTRGFGPVMYDLTRSTVTENLEMLCRSRVGIIIFSKNYACSKQCRDGFVAVMEHLKENNLELLPVYFKVKLLEIRGQTGSFGRAFSRLEDAVQASQVPELISIDRYQYMNGDKVMLAKNIVKDIFLQSISLYNWILKGRLQLKRILNLLNCSQVSGPHIIGLWGMAGIGKTTITRIIFRTEAERYDVCYFLADFHIMCQARGLSRLRDEFFAKIAGDENVIVDACDTKISSMRDRFLSKKVLIVLDGVCNARDAEVLVGGFGWFSAGHTIILTSRNRQVLVQCKAKELYEIQKLCSVESFSLCCQYANELEGSCPMITELVNYASGVPLALRVLSSSVLNQCINNEKQHIKRLAQHPLIEIQDAFEKSFNVLDDNEKSIFLDLACFFRGENKDHVVDILDGCGSFTDLGIQGLIDESLISLVDNRIEMPNIFQDTGRFAVCQENNETGKRSRLWDPSDIVDVLTDSSGTEAIEGIFLDASDLTIELSPAVFERMYRLRLLKLHCPTSKNHCMVLLPQGLHSLPDGLRLLHWERYPLGALPRKFNPKYLVDLNMPYSNMTKLWKGTKNLEKLKRIILSHSRQLTKLPRLSKARNLEHIDLEGCTSLVKVNSSILHLHKLTFLSLKDCSHLRIMPTTIHLESLEVLNLSGCSELKDFHGFAPNLKEVYLAGCAITEIPSPIRYLIGRMALDLNNRKRLLQLPPRKRTLEAMASHSTTRPASFMDLSSVDNMVAPPNKRQGLKRVIEYVILSIRISKRETSVYKAKNQTSSTPTTVNGPAYNSFTGFHILPERPRQPECIFYMKTGYCKFGSFCKFHHPKDRERQRNTSALESSLSLAGLPLRPGKPPCPFYFNTGNCSAGLACRYDHPLLESTHKKTSFRDSESPHLNRLGFSSSIGDSSSELVEPSIQKISTSVASKSLHLNLPGYDFSARDSSSELVEASSKKPRLQKNTSSLASETPPLNLLGSSSSIGDSSSELVDASTKKHKNTSSMASRHRS